MWECNLMPCKIARLHINGWSLIKMVASNSLFGPQHLQSKSWKIKAETLSKLLSKRERHHEGDWGGGGWGSLIRRFQKGTWFGVRAVNYRCSSKQSVSRWVPPFPYTPSATLCRMASPSSGSGARVMHRVLITPDWCGSPSHPLISSRSPVSTITVVGSAKLRSSLTRCRGNGAVCLDPSKGHHQCF